MQKENEREIYNNTRWAPMHIYWTWMEFTGMFFEHGGQQREVLCRETWPV